MSDSVRPHRWQPIRLPCPWDSPGKNTGVGCHFLLRCMKVKSEREVVQSCLTLRDPMDYSLPGSSIHGILQARVLEWAAIAFSEMSSDTVRCPVGGKNHRSQITMSVCTKLLQSCLTFCNPMDYSPPGSSVHGILQARILEWVAISFSNA